METQPLDFVDLQIKVPWGFISGRWYGKRNVRPILALHGWQDNLGTWAPLLPLLPRHIGILCIDFPGHGRSSKLPKGMTYHVLDYVHTILSVIKEFKWTKVSLLCHSMGGVVSYLYATLYPETIDLLIQIDIIVNCYRSPDFLIQRYATFFDKLIIEDERYDDPKEPPSRTFDELVDALHRGSDKSIEKENCRHILERSCSRSAKDPNKFYFSRDPKVKFFMEYTLQNDYRIEMSQRIKNVNHLVIKGTRSNFMENDSYELMKLIKKNNPNFEFYEIDDYHHLHMNKASETAAFITPFICKYRPQEMEETDLNEKDYVNGERGLFVSKL